MPNSPPASHPGSSSSDSRRRLSVAMIVRNEAATLAEGIGSVRSIADEIVVLDTGSTDRSREIATEAGATVHQTTWPDDFAAARNECLAQVTGDWVLWLDGSEQLDVETAGELRAFIDGGEIDANKVYMMLVEIPSADEGGAAEQAAQPRLMPRREGLRFSGRIRESIRPALQATGMQLDAAPGRIARLAAGNTPQRKRARARRDLELVRVAERNDGPLSASLLIAQGDALSNLGEMARARQSYRKALEQAPAGSTEALSAYYGLLPTYDGQPDLADEQLKACMQAVEAYPVDAQLLLALGNYLQQRKQMDLARRAFEAAVGHGQVDLETWHLRELSEVASICLALVLQLQGNDEGARRHLSEAFTRQPRSLRIRRHLLDAHIKAGNTTEALELVQVAGQSNEQSALLEQVVRGACHASRGQWTEALGLLQSAYVSGCRANLCLRWLAFTLLRQGQVESVRPVLAEWLTADPTNVEAQSYKAALDRHDADQQVGRQEADRQLRVDAPRSAPATGEQHTHTEAPQRQDAGRLHR